MANLAHEGIAEILTMTLAEHLKITSRGAFDFRSIIRTSSEDGKLRVF
jgi:hypothetical protein